MSRIDYAGISFDLPAGWEVNASGGSFRLLPGGAREPTVLHIGSFPLPTERSSFGGNAVLRMGNDDVFMVLFEYGPESAGSAPFTSRRIPRPLDWRQFDRNALQRNVPGHSGLQQFFTVAGRALCLYVVLGSHIDRVDLVPKANAILDTLEIT